MVRREVREDAIIAAEVAVDNHAAAQAKRAQDLVERVHVKARSGVSVNLFGSAIILTTGLFA
jgi:hypothetical protein